MANFNFSLYTKSFDEGRGGLSLLFLFRFFAHHDKDAIVKLWQRPS